MVNKISRSTQMFEGRSTDGNGVLHHWAPTTMTGPIKFNNTFFSGSLSTSSIFDIHASHREENMAHKIYLFVYLL